MLRPSLPKIEFPQPANAERRCALRKAATRRTASGKAAVSPFRRAALLWLAGGAALSVFGNLPLMGLPGAIALVPAAPILIALDGGVDLPRDSARRPAIRTTLALGPVVPLAARRPWRLAGWRYAAAALGLSVAGSAAVALAIHAVGVAPMPGSAS